MVIKEPWFDRWLLLKYKDALCGPLFDSSWNKSAQRALVRSVTPVSSQLK